MTAAPHVAPPFLLDERQAGSMLGLTARTMQSWRHSGDGPPHVKISSRCVRYRLSDLEQFAAERLRSSTSDDSSRRPAGTQDAV